jgi:UPF0716 protein FxsA
LLLAVPLAEIATFIVVGGQIGVLPTIALVLVTAVSGSILLRIQGFGVMARIRATLDAGGMPGRDLVHGFVIMAAGLLLLTPGFITDTIGLLLFVPAIRDLAWSLVKDRIVVATSTSYRRGPRGDGQTIDLDEEEFERQTTRRPRNDDPERLE